MTALWVVVRSGRGKGTGGAVAVGLLVVGAIATSAAVTAVSQNTPQPSRQAPPRSYEDGYASSDTCRSCHPSEHASWSRSFHRTMTEAAEAGSVRAPLPMASDLDGVRYAMQKDGDAVTVTVAGTTSPLVMTTGSHHYQAYWIAGARPGELAMFPWVYVFREARFIPRRDVFLQPPAGDVGGASGAEGPGVRWNSNCVACHAVAGKPGHDDDINVYRTRVAELGIACEACHGPGAAHASARRNPVARLSQLGKPDPTIINPARLSPERASAVCGQCHAYAYPRDEAAWWVTGYSGFRPGDALEPTRILLYPETLRAKGAPQIEAATDSLYWSDGTIRVGGREYNGLARSPCFEHGEGERKLSCLSCHSMHESEPDDQLRRDRTTTAACLGCHAGRNAMTHVRHAAGTSATECVSCHMPKTTYALLKGIRSHRIESPSIPSSLATGRPTACNLCHLDRSLAWTQSQLGTWYGVAPVAIPEADRDVPSAAALTLRGDAAMRALVAAALGEPDVRAATGSDWERGMLDELADDRYAAVALIAARSVALYPFPSTRRLVESNVRAALLAQRDERAITISE